MALVYVDKDPWLGEHDACEKLYREIMEQITSRNREQKTSHEYARLSASIRLRLKQYNEEVRQLKEKLFIASSSGTTTAEEGERRTRLVEQLKSKEVQLQQLFHNRNSSGIRDHSALMKPSAFADMGTTGWGTDDEELESTQVQNMSIPELRQQQQQMLRDQDAGLEELSKVISRQKAIATTINTEVDFQNDLIDEIADHVENTDVQISGRTAQIRTVSRKDKTFAYWIIIILLFIAIIVVGVV